MRSVILWLALCLFVTQHSIVSAAGQLRFGKDEHGNKVPLMDTRLKCDFCLSYGRFTTCDGILMHQVSCEYCATIFQTSEGKNSSMFYGCAEYFSPVFLPVKEMTVAIPGNRYIHFCNSNNCARKLKLG